jgi:hypothetical protein
MVQKRYLMKKLNPLLQLMEEKKKFMMDCFGYLEKKTTVP